MREMREPIYEKEAFLFEMTWLKNVIF
jgi:hypothetical protein